MSDLISRADAIEAVRLESAKRGLLGRGDILDILSALPSAEAVQGDAISKRFISDAILQKISELNAQGEKAIPIAREFIRFKRFVDGLTPIRTEAVQEWIPFTRRPMTEEEQKDYPNCTFMFDCVLPDDGDEILVSNRRFVWMDTFCSDIDGCYLDGGDDIDEDMAWMPLPEPYKGGDSK